MYADSNLATDSHAKSIPDNISFSNCFTTFAFKKGGSEVLHIDPDANRLLCVIVVIADPDDPFVGADFCLSSLGWRIPVGHRDILLVSTADLPHFTAPWTGGRYVLTGFVDLLLALHGGWDSAMIDVKSDSEYLNWVTGQTEERRRQYLAKKEKQQKSNEEAAALWAGVVMDNEGRHFVNLNGQSVRRSSRLQAKHA